MRPLCLWHLVLVTGEGVSVGRETGGWWAGSLTSQRRRPGSLDVDVAFPHSPTSLTERNGLTQVAPSKRPADRRKGLAAPRSLVGTLLFSVPALFPPAAHHSRGTSLHTLFLQPHSTSLFLKVQLTLGQRGDWGRQTPCGGKPVCKFESPKT